MDGGVCCLDQNLAGNAIEELVFSGKPHTLLGSLVYRGVDYDLIKIQQVIPAKVGPLNEVRVAIEEQLHNDQRRRALARFVKAWRLRWRAQNQVSRELRDIEVLPLSRRASHSTRRCLRVRLMRRSTTRKQRDRLAAPAKALGCRNVAIASVVCAVAPLLV